MHSPKRATYPAQEDLYADDFAFAGRSSGGSVPAALEWAESTAVSSRGGAGVPALDDADPVASVLVLTATAAPSRVSPALPCCWCSGVGGSAKGSRRSSPCRALHEGAAVPAALPVG